MGAGASFDATADAILRRTSLQEDNLRRSIRQKFDALNNEDGVLPKRRISLRKSGSFTSESIIVERQPSFALQLDQSVEGEFAKLANTGGDIITGEDVMLDKSRIMELLRWVLKFSNEKQRVDEMMGIFSNCVVDGLTFSEFCILYEEVATRVELERIVSKKFKDLDANNIGLLDRTNIIILTDFILSKFATIWCSKQEIVLMKRKLVSLFDENHDEKMSKSELFEIYDGMLVTIRLIKNIKKKIKDFIKEGSNMAGTIDELEQIDFTEAVMRSFQWSGVRFSDVEKEEVRKQIMATYTDGAFSVRELTTLFETIRDRKTTYANLRKTLVPTPKRKTRKLSYLTFRDITDAQLEAIGIDPDVRAKFLELDSSESGRLNKDQISSLLDWMFQYRPLLDGFQYKHEFSIGFLDRAVDFNEFCSMYDDATMRIQLLKLFNTSFAELSADSETIEKTVLPHLVEAVLYPAKELGCHEEERENIKQKLISGYDIFTTLHLHKSDLTELYEDICSVFHMFRFASKKYNELTERGSADIDDDMLDKMSDLMVDMKSNNNTSTKGLLVERRNSNDPSRRRLSRGDSMIMQRMSVLTQDDVNKKRRTLERHALRYKSQVKNLILVLMTDTNDASLLDEP